MLRQLQTGIIIILLYNQQSDLGDNRPILPKTDETILKNYVFNSSYWLINTILGRSDFVLRESIIMQW